MRSYGFKLEKKIINNKRAASLFAARLFDWQA